jgi:hypothetical protein
MFGDGRQFAPLAGKVTELSFDQMILGGRRAAASSERLTHHE